MELSSETQSTSQPSPTLESSSSSFRFPRPAGDNRVNSWVDDTAAASMSFRSEAPSEDGMLGESAYEFIDTDTESRDDATESVASTDLGHPEDDVASLADTEQSGEESGEEDSPAALPSHQAVEQAFNTPTLGRSYTIRPEDSRSLSQSIEFEETYSNAETVSVKHTVATYTEEQTASAIRAMRIPGSPMRIIVTIRQTMTKQGLSTKEPLRILYVGSHAAKQDIIHKIASSVTASVEGGNSSQRLRNSTSQIYNVVPVSAFGSERTPEIELMHSSGYQIKVDDCTLAELMDFGNDPSQPAVIKLTLNENAKHHSVPDDVDRGFVIEPSWEMPHVAVFYCSENDDFEAKQTRKLAREFMSRHDVPSIFISHKQLFECGQSMKLDEHAIHMCLETRNSKDSGTTILQRLPIDLASFLNIDARQMNRNLAYITGLHEPSHIPAPEILLTRSEAQRERDPWWSVDIDLAKVALEFARLRLSSLSWRTLTHIGVFVLSLVSLAYFNMPSNQYSQNLSKPTVSVNSKTMAAIPISSTPSFTLPLSAPSITSAPSSTAVKMSTRTTTITVTQSLAPGPNSLSVLPSKEIGKPQTSKVPEKTEKCSVCETEIVGEREILIRIPSPTKLSWLAKEAMQINITRSNITVDAERAYSSDEGIILLLPKNEAYGVLNISIITTKKPRVNETFQVDFGTPTTQAWRNLVATVSSLLPDIGGADFDLGCKATQEKMYEAIKTAAEEAQAQMPSLTQLDEARRVAMEQVSSVTGRLAELAKSASFEGAKRSAIVTKEVGIQIAEAEAAVAKYMKSLQHLRQPIDDGLLKAQVQSKLFWLKVQGREKEYRAYEKRAADAGRRRAEAARKSGEELRKKVERMEKKVAKKEARANRKATKKGRRA
jgi:hypothetical protein